MITTYKFLNGFDEEDIQQFFKIRNDRLTRGYSRKQNKNQVTENVKKYFISNRVVDNKAS